MEVGALAGVRQRGGAGGRLLVGAGPHRDPRRRELEQRPAAVGHHRPAGAAAPRALDLRELVAPAAASAGQARDAQDQELGIRRAARAQEMEGGALDDALSEDRH